MLNRRRFLGLGAVAATSSLSGCGFRGNLDSNGSRAQAASVPASYADRFETVVTATEEADGTDERSVASLFREHAGRSVLFYFPPGRYLLDSTVRLPEFERLGIVGRDATIVPQEGDTSILFDIGRAGRASEFLMEGIEFDFRARNTGPRPLSALVSDYLEIRDLSVRGAQDAGWGMMRLDVTDPEGHGFVERLRLPDGANVETQSTGCLVGSEHRGEIAFSNCFIVGFPDNGLYAEPNRGSVAVLGGYFSNCGIASLRVGNNSLVRNVHVRCDVTPPGFENMRGIRLREGRNVLVENCRVDMLDVSGSDGGLVLAPWLESAIIRNTTVRIEVDDVTGVNIKPPAHDPGLGATVQCEGLTVTGGADGGAAVVVDSRDGCSFDNVSISQTGSRRDGFRFRRVNDAVINDSRVNVTGRPVVTMDSTVRQIDVTTHRAPSIGWPR
jgi:hypothetical protein